MSNMDTPEGDVFAIQSGAIESLPAYVEEETALTSLQAFIGTLPPSSSHLHPLDQATINAFIESQTVVQPGTKSNGPPEPIMDYPSHADINPTDEVMRIREAIVTGFFDAISKGRRDVIAMFINNNLVSVETTNMFKKTPLLAAIDAKNVQIVQWLIGFGADVNAFGVEVCMYPTSPSLIKLSTVTDTRCAPLSIPRHTNQTHPTPARGLHRPLASRQVPHGSSPRR